ncbi:hypothetical protein BV22DRAFT_1048782 [Leucogyrophana mollusca]|uniref:Uncharacterized protein n=1 Tax=Leucogyrophana mollusca TaxID=85980 RepID=A0ACB8BBR2_9AGAM|nr:hypothetical protein BV22DRAFT_1048782 [Leucogyrophana mollusca]
MPTWAVGWMSTLLRRRVPLGCSVEFFLDLGSVGMGLNTGWLAASSAAKSSALIPYDRLRSVNGFGRHRPGCTGISDTEAIVSVGQKNQTRYRALGENDGKTLTLCGNDCTRRCLGAVVGTKSGQGLERTSRIWNKRISD